MALSGTVNTDSYQGRYVSLTWEGTQSIANNTTTISWALKGAGEANSSWYYSGPFKLTIDGKVVYESTTRIKLYNGTTIKSGTTTITHGTDGKKSITISVKAAIYASGYNKSGSKDFTLNAIPRKATITSAPNFNDEGNPTINYSNPKGNRATALQACIASSDGNTIYADYRNISKTGTSYTFNLTTAERTALRNACKNANSMSVRFYVRTTISGTNFHHYKTKKLSIINATPTIAPTAIEEQDDNGIKNSAATGSTSRWVKGYSDIAYAFNLTLKKGATVKSYAVSCGTKTGTTASGVLHNIDSKDVKFTLIDSRGNKVQQTISGTLVNYIKPTCSLGVTSTMSGETTAKATLNIKGAFFNGILNATSGVNNAITVQYRYKPDGGSYTAWTAVTATKSGNSYSVNTTLAADFDYRTIYTFQARVQDDFYKEYSNYINSNTVVLKIQPIFDWSDTDFNFNVPVTAPSINGYPVGTNKVLWSGGYYMTAGQIANLNGTVSSQASGIILVFSRYDGAPLNQHWSYHFVPKIMVQLHEGEGSIFDLSTSKDSYRASKYLYINDDKIVGNDNNADTGTGATGVKYTNNAFVLRYVIGV